MRLALMSLQMNALKGEGKYHFVCAHACAKKTQFGSAELHYTIVASFMLLTNSHHAQLLYDNYLSNLEKFQYTLCIHF